MKCDIKRDFHGSRQCDTPVQIPATFQIIYMIGWKPDGREAKPLKRGSGEVSLKDALDPGVQQAMAEAVPVSKDNNVEKQEEMLEDGGAYPEKRE
jgi:hypothetical protein